MLSKLAAASARQSDRRRVAASIDSLKKAAGSRSKSRFSFAAALRGPGLSLIAEHKRRSPSKGDIRPGSSASDIAEMYAAAGAAAVSVLTEEESFGGSLQDLADVRDVVDVPILRKDFITSQYQLYEAAACGADAVLLIAAVLSTRQLKELYGHAGDLSLDCLVEVHNEAELKRALMINPKIIGINNRDLKTFKVDIETTYRLLPLIPPDVITVAESGFSTADELQRLQEAGIDAVLIGETLMRAKDPAQKARELLNRL